MAVVRGSLGKFPVVLASATPSIESHVNARTGRYAPRRPAGPLLRRRAAGGRRPSTCASTRPSEGKWLSPVLVEAVTETLGRQAAGAAVPQPPRLRAADAVPLLRPSHRLPAVHGLAGRAPLSPPARTATTAASRCRSRRSAPSAASPTRSSPAARASSASPRRWPSAFPRRALALLSSDLVPVADRDARDHQDHRGGRGRHHHRHADGGQGPPLPAARDRRHRRRRSGARPGRPARRRAHLPAPAPGDGPRRPRAAPPAAASCRPTCPSTR